jgi:hypothetical protein
MTMKYILESDTRAASGSSDPFMLPEKVRAVSFFLNVTNAATDVGDILDVYIQESPDDGTTWNDIAKFTSVLGNGGAKKYLAFIGCAVSPESELALVQSEAMSAGVRQGPIIPLIRASYVITDAGTDDASFTFALSTNVIM